MNGIHDAQTLDLAGIDLNLVVAFDAMAHEKSVTRAAERMGVTQSAMSHALRRLRELLNDQLFVRGHAGGIRSLVLTPRAQALSLPVRSALVTLGRALVEPEPFAPHSARRTFAISTPDLFDVWAGPTLLERTRREAPGIDFVITPLNRQRLAEQLETGEVDAALVPQLDGAPESGVAQGLQRRSVLRDSWLCYIRADHPALHPAAAGGRSARAQARAKRAAAVSSNPAARPRRKPKLAPAKPSLSLAAFAALSHLLVSTSGVSGPALVDQLLAQHGLRRRIVLRVPAFYSALPILAKSDLVLTAPGALASLVPADGSIVAMPVPLALPQHSLNLLWHERFSRDPGHTWLRNTVADSCKR